MSDIALRMTLVDDVSNKLNKIATSGKNVATQLATAGKEIDKAFQTKSPDTFVSKVGKAMSEAEKEVESLGSTIDSIDDSFSSKSGHWDISNSGMTWIDDVAEQAEEAGKSMDKASNSAKKLKDGLSGVGDDADGLSDVGDDAEELGESMSSASGQVVDFSGALKTLFGVAVGAKVFGEVKDYISNSIEVGKDYTSMISEVAAISGATGSDLDLMEESARKWGATTVFSASDAAEALKYMSLAGWSAQQSTSALGGVLNLAAASGMGLGEASDMVTDYLSAFGMEASKSAYFADMLAYAQSNSNTTAAQLGEAYRNSAANLHAAGQDVETTTSLLEAMANQGYKGSEAGTALAATMRDITQKMEDGNIQIGDTSVAVQDSQGNFRDLTDILMDVENATDGMGDAQKAAALGSTFTSDSIKALNMILTEGMDKVSGYEKALRSASGTSDQMAGTMNDNLSGDMANMQSALEEMQLQSFEALEEPLRGFVQYVTNDVIPTLTEWVPEAVGSLADGVSELGQALSPIFETIIKNPEAVGNAFISMAAGLTALKAVNTGFKIADKVTELGGMTNALSKFGTMLFGNPWAAGAAATVAALTAVGLAIHSYNKQQVQDSLSERFGDIELTSSQIKDSAEHIINAKYLVNVEGALNKFENADQLAEDAEKALHDNDAIEWQASIGMTLDESSINTYTQNIDTFIQSSIDELESRSYAATITVETMIGGSEEGQTLATKMGEWASADQLEMNSLSKRLKSAVEKALEDGVLDVNEQAAITILQSKMNNILAGWQEADSQAQLDLIGQKYSSMSGKDLTAESFGKLVDELGKQRKSNSKTLDSSYTEMMSYIHGFDNSGRLEEAGLSFSSLKSQADYAYRNAKASSLKNSVDFESKTVSDTYGDTLEKSEKSMQKSAGSSFYQANSLMEQGDEQLTYNQLTMGYSQAMQAARPTSNKEAGALQEIYSAMQPDVSAMQSLVSEYQQMGQAIPQELMTSFNNAMQVGAAAGDTSAAWQVYANQMVADPANDALVKAIQTGTQGAPQELKDALTIAMADTTSDPVEMSDIAVSLASLDLDTSQIAEITHMSESEVQSALDKSEVKAEEDVNLKTKAGEVDNSGAEEVGKQAQEEAKSAAGEDETIEKKENIKYEKGSVDKSELESESGKEELPERTAEQTVKTDEKYVKGSEDKSQLESESGKKLPDGTAQQDITTNQTYKQGTKDTSQLDKESEAAQPKTTTQQVTANTQVTAGSDNFATVSASLASKFSSALKSAFNKTFSATANASIHVNYSIANPTKTITFSGGGSGTATVHAHALGGIFDEPHFGVLAEAGPEAYIPIDGSDNAKGIWEETGRMLGMLGNDAPIQVAPTGISNNNSTFSKNEDAGVKDSHRTIDININGNGKISIDKGTSKEEVVQILLDNAKDIFVSIVEQEALVGGDASYEY